MSLASHTSICQTRTTTTMDQYKTKEDVLKLAILDPELEETLKHTPPPQMDFSSPVEHLRAMVTGMEQHIYNTCPTFDTQESKITIPMRDGYKSELCIIKPPANSNNNNNTSSNPVIVLIFGGGFIMGSNMQCINWGRVLASLYGATVVQLSYRLAPEHRFPHAPNDVWDTVKWVSENESLLDADLTKGFVLGGGSAGGNLSIVTAHRAVKENLSPPITGLLTSVPVCISPETVPEKYKELWISRDQNADAPGNPGLDSKAIGGYEAFYQQDFLSEDFTPFSPNAEVSIEALRDRLPRTYVQIAGLDILRDDGLVYALALRDAGVEVRLDAYPGVPHGHFNIWPKLKQSVKSQEDTIWHFGWLLRREVEREKVDEVVAKMIG